MSTRTISNTNRYIDKDFNLLDLILTLFQKPSWGFGTGGRMSKDKPKYDFYENNMFLDDPMAADLSRKEKCKAPKIGTEPRVSSF